MVSYYTNLHVHDYCPAKKYYTNLTCNKKKWVQVLNLSQKIVIDRYNKSVR